MATDLKRIRVLEFKGKIADWEGWSAKFLARGKRLGYKKLLLGKEKIPTEREYAKDVINKSTDKRGELLGSLACSFKLTIEYVQAKLNHRYD